jgi:hypothetical protein
LGLVAHADLLGERQTFRVCHQGCVSMLPCGLPWRSAPSVVVGATSSRRHSRGALWPRLPAGLLHAPTSPGQRFGQHCWPTPLAALGHRLLSKGRPIFGAVNMSIGDRVRATSEAGCRRIRGMQLCAASLVPAGCGQVLAVRHLGDARGVGLGS